jgi:hypothetical protein
LILQRYGREEPSETRYTPNSPGNQQQIRLKFGLSP